MKKYTMIMILTLVAFTSVNITAQESNKGRLLSLIIQKQNKIEQQIVDLWLTGERGKKLELLLSEYITLEVRYRAISGKDTNKTLINSVSQNKQNNNSTHIDLAKKLVIEYFKRKGIDMQKESFVTGNYMILAN